MLEGGMYGNRHPTARRRRHSTNPSPWPRGYVASRQGATYRGSHSSNIPGPSPVELGVMPWKRRRRPSDRTLVTEECLGAALEGAGEPRLLTGDGVLSLLSLDVERNMPPGQQSMFLGQALRLLDENSRLLEDLAETRARHLLDDHRRIREAGEARGIRYSVIPALPVDVIGIYVLVPAR